MFMSKSLQVVLKSIKLIFLIAVIYSCNTSNEPIVITPEDYHASVDKVSQIMIHDIFSPPVASRVFAYPNVAAYEILVQKDSVYTTLSNTVAGLKAIPKASETEPVNLKLSALIAHMEVSKMLVFSEDRIDVVKDSLFVKWQDINNEEFVASKNYALKVVDHIKSWMDKDNYNQTRTMEKFTVDTDDPSRWQPTPPAYMEGIEPHWSKIRPFLLETADQFKPIPPPEFSLDKDSDFYKELLEVYTISEEITKEGDTSEEIAIAQFWDCNPFVSVTRGHFMFATKKISPGAHWIGIVKIAAKKTDANFMETVNAYTKTSLAIADAFISCWDEKYRSNLIRPETLINQNIDQDWVPILQTPPFPEYTSGHSVVSGAASTVLTSIFGDNFAFDDDTEVPFGLPVRSFDSFSDAADEAAISRMYGGIHYRAAVEVGVEQGRNVGAFITQKLAATN
ncbi:Phosphoesterase, PA-phosphatase-like protein [Polaribacter dokdonensis DSW-5]|uniref:Phosphoesterase, PA-phosphatase-like protein n=2 Tax=Polaribacter dokdonensis DSW-5 TaxID=1300348 RepID=A0A0M9CE21_9FLAO|nr:Phosphoesterase, PA-phosphatase-like protein [Polaribacter dokdonensis DSW-5]